MLLALLIWFLNTREDVWFVSHGLDAQAQRRLEWWLVIAAVLIALFFLASLGWMGYSFSCLATAASSQDVALTAFWTTQTWWGVLMAMLMFVL